MLCATDITLAEPPKKMGGGERHLSLKLAQHKTTLRGVAFGGGEWADAIASCAGPLSVAFGPVINEFRGRRTVELHVADWRRRECRVASNLDSARSAVAPTCSERSWIRPAKQIWLACAWCAINSQRHGIRDRRVLDAMARVPRERFVEVCAAGRCLCRSGLADRIAAKRSASR